MKLVLIEGYYRMVIILNQQPQIPVLIQVHNTPLMNLSEMADRKIVLEIAGSDDLLSGIYYPIRMEDYGQEFLRVARPPLLIGEYHEGGQEF